MKTNDLRKGASVRLANGWFAKIADNARGNIRMAEVVSRISHGSSSFGVLAWLATPPIRRLESIGRVDRPLTDILSERGYVYSHDITQAYNPQTAKWEAVEHTPAQVKLRTTVYTQSTTRHKRTARRKL